MAVWEDALPREVTLRWQLNKGVSSAPCLSEIVPALCHPLGRAGACLPWEPPWGCSCLSWAAFSQLPPVYG